MTFDLASFFLGMVTLAVIAWLGYQIISIVQLRMKEEEQWRTIQAGASPSEAYIKTLVEREVNP